MSEGFPMLNRILLAAVALGVVGVASPAWAAPLSVEIEDHDFTLDVPYWDGAGGPWGVVYDYNGAGADLIYLQSPVPNHYVPSYSYAGLLATLLGGPAASAFPYPVANSATSGGDLELTMSFTTNDGPYTAPGGDRFDISLVGDSGHLIITGQIFNQAMGPASAPLYPAAPLPNDIVLLDIDFTAVTLLARVGENRLFKVEGRGKVNTLLGEPAAALGFDLGEVMFDFVAEVPDAPIFTNPNYSPSDNIVGTVLGGIGGHAGVPEPATLALVGLGLVATLVKRRRK